MSHELTGEGLLLRIFIGESDHWEGKPLHEALMLRAREVGLAGCTIIRGPGRVRRRVANPHHAHPPPLGRPPMVIEIVDTPEKVRGFLPEVERMVGDGLATVEPVEVHFYRAKRRSQ